MAFIVRLVRVLSIVAVIIGALLKIQHYSYGGMMLTGGCIGLALSYLGEFVINEIAQRRKR